eukprot:CAMPEP_0177779264 /NCGR_PEP_ID=MMETSP0491_2-20121128/16476_1 /TAXON_ID=63592 /ORGANISM="Tetraselmis chuii, Strain PLY429" /LENGTH=70 /DNA_ID=CAMNT_0019298755 /DNA_START=28 /DNA_END=241 /DNA_ORIENTATION=-
MAPQEDGHESVSDDSEDEDFCPVAEGGERQKRGRGAVPGGVLVGGAAALERVADLGIDYPPPRRAGQHQQ